MLFCVAMTFLVILSGCVSTPPINKKFASLTVRGEMSDVILAYVNRQYFVEQNNIKVNFPGGLVFYYIIRPKDDYQDHMFVVDEQQRFTINGEEYNVYRDLKWHITNDDGTEVPCEEAPEILPDITIFSKENFASHEPEISQYLTDSGVLTNNDTHYFVQKNILCGDKLPKQGSIEYRFSVGFATNEFDRKMEGFDFKFKIEDVL
jgi:hypothetical protein